MKKAVCIMVLGALSLSLAAFQAELVVPVVECFEGESIQVEIRVFPARPAQTSLEIESVPRDFSLVSSRKERKRLEDPSSFSPELVDSVVFVQEWATGTAGLRVLGPFIVVVDGIEQVLAPVEIRVQARHDARRGEIRWIFDTDSPTVRQGTPVPLVLEGRNLFEILALECPPPRNALLEQSERSVVPGTTAGSDWVPVAHFTWTPLSGGVQPLPVARLMYRSKDGEDAVAGISRTTVSVLTADPVVHEQPDSPLLSAAFTASAADDGTRHTADKEIPVPLSVKNSADPVAEAAARAWQSGRYGEALASLRHSEYVSFFPRKYRIMRQDAEHALGFSDYPSPPSKPFVRVVSGFLLVSLFGFVLVFPLRKKSRALSVVLGCMLCVIAVSALAGAAMLPSIRYPEAVCTGSVLRQIPEETAGVVTTIPEGTPVSVLKKTGAWYYVRLPAAGEGWVSDAYIIPYTSAGFYGFW